MRVAEESRQGQGKRVTVRAVKGDDRKRKFTGEAMCERGHVDRVKVVA